MKLINVALPSEQSTVEIVPLFDCHVGAFRFNNRMLSEKIAYILAAPNRYAILGGDMINNSIPDSVAAASCYEEVSPTEQINTAVSLLDPIKDRILAIVNGNHEDRTYKKTGIDIGQNIAVRLGCSDRFEPTAILLFLEHGKDPKAHVSHGCKSGQILSTIYISHGVGSGRTIGAKANAAARFGEIVDADIALVGHTHQLLAFPQCRFRIDTRHRSIKKVDQLVVNCDSTAGYEAYAERNGFRPSSERWPVITLEVGKLPRCTF